MITREDLTGFVQEYFDTFCEADATSLTRLLHRNVHLRDWATDIKGRETVVKAMVGIVNSFADVTIEVTDMTIDVNNASVAARIIITLGSEKLNVLDLITFEIIEGDAEGGIIPASIKITQIDAYQQ